MQRLHDQVTAMCTESFTPERHEYLYNLASNKNHKPLEFVPQSLTPMLSSQPPPYTAALPPGGGLGAGPFKTSDLTFPSETEVDFSVMARGVESEVQWLLCWFAHVTSPCWFGKCGRLPRVGSVLPNHTCEVGNGSDAAGVVREFGRLEWRCAGSGSAIHAPDSSLLRQR
jgi:hypothetical protein